MAVGPVLSEPVIQVFQDLTIVVFAPGVSGAIAKIEARGSLSPTTTSPSFSAKRPSCPKTPVGFSSPPR
jgi:hypothetical protein